MTYALAAAVLGERLSLRDLLCMGLIVAGLLLVTFGKARERARRSEACRSSMGTGVWSRGGEEVAELSPGTDTCAAGGEGQGRGSAELELGVCERRVPAAGEADSRPLLGGPAT